MLQPFKNTFITKNVFTTRNCWLPVSVSKQITQLKVFNAVNDLMTSLSYFVSPLKPFKYPSTESFESFSNCSFKYFNLSCVILRTFLLSSSSSFNFITSFKFLSHVSNVC